MQYSLYIHVSANTIFYAIVVYHTVVVLLITVLPINVCTCMYVHACISKIVINPTSFMIISLSPWFMHALSFPSLQRVFVAMPTTSSGLPVVSLLFWLVSKGELQEWFCIEIKT